MFRVVKRERFQGGVLSHEVFYACTAGGRHRWLLWSTSPATRSAVYDFRIFGPRLGFIASSEGFAMGAERLVGWVDLRSGRRASGAFFVDEVTEHHGLLPDGGLAYALAPDGAVALAVQEAGGRQVVAEMLPRRAALSGPRSLHISATPTIALGSIAVTLTTVSWRTLSGVEESVSR